MSEMPLTPQLMQNSCQRVRSLPAWLTNLAATTTLKDDKRENVKNVSGKSETVVNVLERALPYLEFQGKTFCYSTVGDAGIACESILGCLRDEADQFVVGFDMEWDVTYSAGKTCTTALLQLCVNENECHLFHLASMLGFPRALKYLLQDPRIMKVGIGIQGDFWKLERDFGFPVLPIIETSVTDIGDMARKILNKPGEKWSLDGLTKHMLNAKLQKDDSIRKSRWSNWPLSMEQKHYASTDAYASLMIYKKLKLMELAKS